MHIISGELDLFVEYCKILQIYMSKKVQVLNDSMYIPDPNPTGPKSCVSYTRPEVPNSTWLGSTTLRQSSQYNQILKETLKYF
jgi:hypothetical protein